MRPSGAKAVLLLVAALSGGALSAGSPPQERPPDPYAALDRELHKDLVLLSARSPQSDEARHAAIALYGVLHDLRNHAAFSELWRQLKWSKPEINVLYVGSGSHMAPLVFLNGGSALRRAHFTYTELDPHSPERVEALLRFFQSRGICRGLTVEAHPLEGTPLGARWENAQSGPGGADLRKSVSAFVFWYGQNATLAGANPGFEVRFRFSSGPCAVEIQMVIGAQKTSGEGPGYFRVKDLERADLVVTHDWDSSPRGNLRVLRDLIVYYGRGSRSRPLMVMMEDLEKYPYPTDLEFFDPLARSHSGYGHVEYAALPGGERLDYEDGVALYGGGIILRPDTGFFCSLPEARLDAFFDFLYFAPTVYGRHNVDLLSGKLVVAPAILDLDAGYGYADVAGEDVRKKEGYLKGLAEQALWFLDSPPALPHPLLLRWCETIGSFRRNLDREAQRDLSPLLKCRADGPNAYPFLKSQGARRRFQEACANRAEVEARLEKERPSFCEAAVVLDQAASRIAAACGGKEAP